MSSIETPEKTHAGTKSKVDPVPNGMHTVTPHLVCDGAGEAMDFYKKAFGAIEVARLAAPNGRLMHGMVRIGDSAVMLVDEFPEMGVKSPLALNGSPVTIHLQVENADAMFERAVKAGATPIMPVADMFWGDRYGIVKDPFGHHWSIATHVRDLTSEEILEASKNANCQG